MLKTTPKICIEDLKARNEGRAVWEWIELPVDEDDLNDFIWDEVLEEDSEEYIIADWQGIPMEFSPYLNPYKVNEIVWQLQEFADRWPEEVIEILVENVGLEEALEILEEHRLVILEGFNLRDNQGFRHKGDLAYRMWEEGMLGMEIPERLENYIDWEAIERTVKSEGNWTVGEHWAVITY
jgi:hypothetical protein